jgi:hypothetical protein
MTIVRSREVVETTVPGDIEVLIKEARRRTRQRRFVVVLVIIVVIVGLGLAYYGSRRITDLGATAHHDPGTKALAATPQNVVPSPYPATLQMTPGLSQSSDSPQTLHWGTRLSTAQARWVTLSSFGSTYRWGVWRPNGLPQTFPVRSTDGGATWTAAGPQLASDWAGGSLFYVSRVLAESPSAVVMVSNSIIDVTTDSGHHWFQYLYSADSWNMTRHNFAGGRIGLRIGPASFAYIPPKNSFALYELNVAQHQWHRVSESLG